MKARRVTSPRLAALNEAWLTHDDQGVLSARHLAILEAVCETGSLNAAAKSLRISYRDAWEKIRVAEAQLGVALLTSQAGGARGGGSRLTRAAEQLVVRLRAFHTEQRHATARAAVLYFDRAQPAGRRNGADSLQLATTTSLVDSGLLAALLPPFTRRMGIEVDVRAVGSGAALRLAHRGRADIVLSHAPDDEARAVAAGDLVNPRLVMSNAFVVVGPPDDPASIRRASTTGLALQRIAAKGAPFLSRGDASGTHRREQELLTAAHVRRGKWYQPQRAGMADLLRRADEAGAYALTDRGTFAALAESLSLKVLFDDDAELINRYSVLATNPYRHPGANYVAAMALIGWLTSPAAQELIAAFRVSGRWIARPAATTSRA